MKSLFIVFTLFFNSPHELHQLRDLFPLIGANEASNKKMITIVTNNQKIALPVKKAYLASAQMASAKFKMFPIAKYQAFMEGKKLLEESIRLDNKNVETRFMRYVIQTHIPSFLFYSHNIEEDKTYIKNALPLIKFSDPDLYQRITSYFGKH
jgi:hypothetical protein